MTRYLLIASVTLTLLFLLVVQVILPAWKRPLNRTYTSKLGYASVLRASNQPFSVKAAQVTSRTLTRHIVGEGLVASDSVLVPILPLDTVARVLVREGQKVSRGQTLAELDETEVRYRVESANLAVTIARAELERTKLGTTYIAAQERPESDRIRLSAFEKQLKILTEQESVYLKAVSAGTLPPIELYDLQNRITQTLKEVEEYRYKLKTSQSGQIQSQIVAESQLRDAQLNSLALELKLARYKVRAPADGVIAQVLIREGEYNQDIGKPAFVMASGMWFDCHIDQAAVSLVKENDAAEIYLEARKGRPVTARVEFVVPIVTFSTGGPEATRPLTPRGSGAPEWPATFKVRLKIDEEYLAELYHGMTGFARIQVVRHALAIPQSALQAVAASHAVVQVLDGQNRELRTVRIGMEADGYVEVLDGLHPLETILTDGHQVLEASDAITVQSENL